jgi:hypothetical protein
MPRWVPRQVEAASGEESLLAARGHRFFFGFFCSFFIDVPLDMRPPRWSF